MKVIINLLSLRESPSQWGGLRLPRFEEWFFYYHETSSRICVKGDDYLLANEINAISMVRVVMTIIGSKGQDTLGGGPGNDVLDGGSGKDMLYGHKGRSLRDQWRRRKIKSIFNNPWYYRQAFWRRLALAKSKVDYRFCWTGTISQRWRMLSLILLCPEKTTVDNQFIA